MHNKNKVKQQGFTLIELMVTVAIVAILSAIAVPSYVQYVQRGNRAQAMATLLQDSNWMEQQFTINNAYPTTLSSTATPSFPGFQSPPTGAAVYNISLVSASSTVTTYTLQAVPVATTPDKCGTFTLDNTGLRSVSGTASSTTCWSGH